MNKILPIETRPCVSDSLAFRKIRLAVAAIDGGVREMGQGLIHGRLLGQDIKGRMLMVRGQASLLDRDVAVLYGMETREVVQALRNNPDKFPAGYVVQLNAEEFKDWRSKILTSNLSDAEKTAIKMGLRRAPYAFTEKGVYMLATILKGERAVKTTIRIIETYAQLRSMTEFGGIEERADCECAVCRQEDRMTANKRIFLNIVAPVRRSLGVGGTYGRSLYALAFGLFTARWGKGLSV